MNERDEQEYFNMQEYISRTVESSKAFAMWKVKKLRKELNEKTDEELALEMMYEDQMKTVYYDNEENSSENN